MEETVRTKTDYSDSKKWEGGLSKQRKETIKVKMIRKEIKNRGVGRSSMHTTAK